MQAKLVLADVPIPLELQAAQNLMQTMIDQALRKFAFVTDNVVAEASLKSVANGWKAQPESVFYTNDPFLRTIRVVEGGVVVFQKDIRLEITATGVVLKIIPVEEKEVK
jgi:hypothetical protein